MRSPISPDFNVLEIWVLCRMLKLQITSILVSGASGNLLYFLGLSQNFTKIKKYKNIRKNLLNLKIQLIGLVCESNLCERTSVPAFSKYFFVHTNYVLSPKLTPY